MSKSEQGGLIVDQNLLKWIAVITMTIDHAGMILFPQLRVMRLIGRLAFPIYCYLLVQGFLHTKSRTKYMSRLAAFAFISELPFDLACYGVFSWRGQSVFVTLFFCLGMLWLMESVLKNSRLSNGIKWLSAGLILALTAVVTHLLACDYSFSAPFLVAGLYFYVRHKAFGDTILFMSQPYMSFMLFFAAMFFSWMLKGYSPEASANGVITEAFCLPAAWLIQICNGRRRKKSGKYFFYLYYPLHLLILYGIGRLYW